MNDYKIKSVFTNEEFDLAEEVRLVRSELEMLTGDYKNLRGQALFHKSQSDTFNQQAQSLEPRLCQLTGKLQGLEEQIQKMKLPAIPSISPQPENPEQLH